MNRLLVIGQGMVGHHFIRQFIQQLQSTNQRDQWQITLIGEEPHLAYDRVHLSEYFEQGAEHLALTSAADYQQNNIEALTNARVVDIDRDNQTVTTDQGQQLDYTHLVLATGSYPFVPPIEGRDQDHCFVYRTLDDLDSIAASAKSATVGTVIGGGLLGLEAANALKSLGLEAQVVEFAPRLMPVQVDERGGEFLKRLIEETGVDVLTNHATLNIEPGESHRYQLNFKDHPSIKTDLVVFSAGIRPRDELAEQAGLDRHERGGVLINNDCQTSDPNIYAIGEVACWNNQIFGLVAPGYRMAEAAAAHLCGQSQPFSGADMSTKLKLLGTDVCSIGDAHAQTAGAVIYEYSDGQANVYRKLVVSADGQHLLGAVLVGSKEGYDTLLQYYLNGMTLPENPAVFILPDSGDAPTLDGDALPDTATLCSCLNVTKGDVVQAVQAGCCSVADVKDATNATTGCGGCAQLIKDTVNAELVKQGIEVNNHLCEHFPYSRDELLHIIQSKQIRTFRELLAEHGEGLGCDICKPTVGGILASLWNEHVLDKEHMPLQDTNDAFLANMQKNGTYSVVPRIAGGEITPEGLICIGEIAKDFNLYTKITGGQRIDLFGAQLHELPIIWERLRDAGFETGQAYGKSVRTVKSCVGSTWCRYGVQDSVGMAIQIEHRYKGIRAPHKVKFAVSGCTRECAEAQSKDFGVIATENGWNLYVCGNGGMKPRHADLFATDLDDETLIRYIDRIFMFYIRTGDRLQRTARWLENLDGGLDYLRDVIINDHLGINAELEAQMQHLISTYQCEWAATLDNPEKLKRFRTFVNAAEPDDSIVFVNERGQRRPANADERQHLIHAVSTD
ncbi:nitrite reductase large subunit NirB [Reinekea blandensis]|uniref:Putative NAD(P)H-nitrite reductase, large subunit n=1 Tax=Reinekea blandensis MED297 TaxID=314283 RepID=A4BAX5_9GAMM|nr:nitrite reductase large subunit NirB [Reinekea blandensis]EAR10588.1 putative NAD(P)H-nitrite reductase, large subunit [Reinekea sp. MED297] [Reinekea blandensis MED297]